MYVDSIQASRCVIDYYRLTARDGFCNSDVVAGESILCCTGSVVTVPGDLALWHTQQVQGVNNNTHSSAGCVR